MSIRLEKIASVIKRTVAPAISNLANENKFGLASITQVKLSKDLRVASIYINLLVVNSKNKEEQTQAFLNLLGANNGMIRSIVAKETRMRFTPELRFFYDDTFEQMEHIENLLNKVKAEAPYKDDYGDESVYSHND
jgi:ribosome-binding factor A